MPKAESKRAPESECDSNPALAKQPRQDDNSNVLESFPLYLDTNRYNKVKLELYKKEVRQDTFELVDEIASSTPWCENCFELDGSNPTEEEINAAARLLELYIERFKNRKKVLREVSETMTKGTGDLGSLGYKERFLALVFVALGVRPMLHCPPSKFLEDEEVMVLLKEAGIVGISGIGVEFVDCVEYGGRDLSMILVRKENRAWRMVLEELDRDRKENIKGYHTQFGLLVGYTVENVAWYVSGCSNKPKEEFTALVRSEMDKLRLLLVSW